MSYVCLCFSSPQWSRNSVSEQDQAGLQAITALEPDLGSLRDRITPGPQECTDPSGGLLTTDEIELN